MDRFVAYFRVSTARQGQSGLGLEAQRAKVAAFTGAVVAEFVEVESGRKTNRPQLHAALRACRLYGARLVVAKFDRLSRNAAFLMTLKDSGVDFVAADMPEANSLTVGIMALVAQQEAEAISQRTKEALAAAKARGSRIGGGPGPNPAAGDRGREASLTARREAATARRTDLLPEIEAIRAAGITALAGIARELNRRGIETPRRRGQWQAAQVGRLLGQYA